MGKLQDGDTRRSFACCTVPVNDTWARDGDALWSSGKTDGRLAAADTRQRRLPHIVVASGSRVNAIIAARYRDGEVIGIAVVGLFERGDATR